MKKLLTFSIAFMLAVLFNTNAIAQTLSHTVSPAGGEVFEISEIVVTFDQSTGANNLRAATTGIFDSEGNNLINNVSSEFTRSDSNKKFHFKPSNGTITTPGTYTFKMAAGSVSTAMSMSSGTKNAEIEVIYTVVAPPLVPGEAVTPEVGSTVMDLSTITIPFDEPVVTQGAASLITLGGKAVDAVTMSADGLTAIITSSATFDAGNVSLSIPKGFFKQAQGSGVNAAFSYTWNVVKASMGITAPEYIFKSDVANVTLDLTNGIAFAGFQLDMVLPAGLEIEPIVGSDCNFVLSRANNHNIMVGTSRDITGAIRLLSYSNGGEVYTGNEGTLVTFAVRATNEFEGGNIAISNIKFADADGVKYDLANVNAAIESRTYVSEIQIAPAGLNLETNQKSKVIANVLPEAAFDKTFEWSSSNDNIVTVDEEGNVNAVGVGEAYIIATAQDGSGVKAQIPVKVVYTHAQNLAIEPAAFNIEATQTKQLEAVITNLNGEEVETNKSIVWSSSDTSKVTVDENGLVEAIAVTEENNPVIITARIMDGENVVLEATSEVTVKATLATSVTVSPEEVTLEIDGTYTLTATVDELATNKKVVWSVVSGAEYVSIDSETGVVTAIAVTPTDAPAVVKATTVDGSDLSDTAEVIVLATLATNVEVALVDAENNDTELKHTEFVELKATLTGETTKPIVWTAEPADYVNIEVNAETGVAKVTANATVGAVTVYATVENTSVRGSIDLNIVKTPVETIAINYEGVTTFETGATPFEVTATVGPELATDKTYAWSTTDADIAYVNEENKVVFGQKTGEVTLTATANDNAEVKASLTFNVVYTLATEIAISKVNEADDFVLKAGEELELTATPNVATNKTIVWSSDNAAVTVENGLVTALKYVEGNVTIKAQIFNGEEAVVTASQVITLEVTKGDVNNDAQVTVADVNDVALYIIGQDPVGFIEAAADVNNDGDIDIADVILLVNQILDQEVVTPEQ